MLHLFDAIIFFHVGVVLGSRTDERTDGKTKEELIPTSTTEVE